MNTIIAILGENLTSVFPISFTVFKKMGHNRRWNYIANILNLLRSVYLKERFNENMIFIRKLLMMAKKKCWHLK